MIDTFLPTEYEVPATIGNYMKFEDGDNTFRILSSPVLGYKYWVDTKDGKRQPMRKRMTEALDMSQIPDPDEVKHFWAMVVWNCDLKKIQILEITQKSIQRILRGLVKNVKWGNPRDYDIVVNKTGKKMETRYTVTPDPKAPLDKEVAKEYKEKIINLEALFTDGDPFETEKVNPDDIPL